jgi:hypothetical protein
MSDFAETWSLTRGRFVAAISDLNQEQLNWRLHPDTLTIGEMALHVAGAELSFANQLLEFQPEGLEARLCQAATDGCVNDKPFPFSADEITPELVQQALQIAQDKVGPMIENPEPYREKTLVSVLGPVINGAGAFARLGYHPGYHQGQVHLLRTAPGFPA